MEPSLAVLDRDGQFIRRIQPEEAEIVVHRGEGRIEGSGRRKHVVLTRARRTDYEPETRSAGMHPTDVERYDGKKLIVLRRIDPRTGALVKWDNDLSFDELRRGRMRTKRGAVQEAA